MYRNFMDYIYTENSLGNDDQNFVYHEHDLISLDKPEDSWLDGMIKKALSCTGSDILRV
jgi:hypothetical protein